MVFDGWSQTIFRLTGSPWKPDETLRVTWDGAPLDRVTAKGEVQWTYDESKNAVVLEPLFANDFVEKTASYIGCEQPR